MPHFMIVSNFSKPLLDNKMYISEEYGAFKQGFTGVYIILISHQKYRLWVLVRIESPRRFYRVPTIYVLSRSMKSIRVFI